MVAAPPQGNVVKTAKKRPKKPDEFEGSFLKATPKKAVVKAGIRKPVPKKSKMAKEDTHDTEQQKEDHEKANGPVLDYRKKPNFTIIIGRPGSGKSHLLHYKLARGFASGKWNFCLVLCSTKYSGDYDFILNQKMIIDNSDDYIPKVQKLIDMQRHALKEGKTPSRVAVVLDDPLGAVNWFKPFWLALATKFRHWNIDLFFTTQVSSGIPPKFHACATELDVFKCESLRDMTHVFENYQGAMPTDITDAKKLGRFMQSHLPSDSHRYIEITRNLALGKENFCVTSAPPKSQFSDIKINF